MGFLACISLAQSCVQIVTNRVSECKPTRRSSEHTPKSVLDHAKSDARSRSTTGKHGSQLALPPFGTRSPLNSAAPSAMALPRLKKSQQILPELPPTTPPRSASPSPSPCFSSSSHTRTATNSSFGLGMQGVSWGWSLNGLVT
jgi:hypothetical protein